MSSLSDCTNPETQACSKFQEVLILIFPLDHELHHKPQKKMVGSKLFGSEFQNNKNRKYHAALNVI